MVRVTGLEWDSFVKGMAVGKGPGEVYGRHSGPAQGKGRKGKKSTAFSWNGRALYLSKRFSSRRTPEPMQGDTGRGT